MASAQISPRSITLLPLEIIEMVLSEIDQASDLLSLAFTSRTNANLIIPTHTEYRRIRIRTPKHAMWAHLAQRADLARNIREVQLCARQDYTAPDRFPVSLVDDSFQDEDEEKRIDNLCTALRHMKRLATFVWQYEPDAKGGFRTLDYYHEELVLSSLCQAPNLRHLMLRGKCGVHVRDGRGIQRQLYPLWNITNLESLSLVGTVWANKSNSKYIVHLIQRSPNIQHLEVPMELVGLDTCQLPCLKRVGLPMISGAVITSLGNATVNSVLRFLQRNSSTIEALNWNAILSDWLPQDALPNLRCLSGNRDIMASFEMSEHLEMSESIRRPIECLDLWDASADHLAELQAIDVSTLRKLRITIFPSLKSLRTIAQRFGNITWLCLPGSHMELPERIAVNYELPQLLDILSTFRNLEVFRGSALWEAVGVDSQKEAMHNAIIDLIERCPRLRQLDHCNFDVQRNTFKIIKIHRKHGTNGELEQVWYEVLRPLPGNVFDVMMSLFD